MCIIFFSIILQFISVSFQDFYLLSKILKFKFSILYLDLHFFQLTKIMFNMFNVHFI